jgi:hypothetical protein
MTAYRYENASSSCLIRLGIDYCPSFGLTLCLNEIISMFSINSVYLFAFSIFIFSSPGLVDTGYVGTITSVPDNFMLADRLLSLSKNCDVDLFYFTLLLS